ncbi:hypothetical protein V2J09_024106 [Rumex salicifolius]
MIKQRWVLCFTVVALVELLAGNNPVVVEGLGVNWGTQTVHQLPAKTVVQLLKDNGIKKVKLFDADPNSLAALSGTDMEVMVAIPNGDLSSMTDYTRAKDWVQRNVTRYNFNGGVNIKYVAVGNEPFLSSYNGSYLNVTFPALENIQRALNEAGIGDSIKATVPFNADVYDGKVPSAGVFRDDVSGLMTSIVQFLAQNNAPFTVNIYPFISLYGDKSFPIDYAFFDGTTNNVIDSNTGVTYNSAFDANFDTLVSALKSVGHGNMPIIIGEAGWPTDGDVNANIANAVRFYNGLLPKLASNAGTPLRRGYIEMYLFGLLDEDAKSVQPGNFERHWGIFRYDGQPKFPMDLSGKNRNVYLIGAKGVNYLPKQWCTMNPNNSGLQNATLLADKINYACSFSDCTPLGLGSSCSALDSNANASFAFNAYYQAQSQIPEACDFQGFAVVTTQNISQGTCNFTIQITNSAGILGVPIRDKWLPFGLAVEALPPPYLTLKSSFTLSRNAIGSCLPAASVATTHEIVERVAVAVVGELVVAGRQFLQALRGYAGEIAAEFRVLGENNGATSDEAVNQILLDHT